MKIGREPLHLSITLLLLAVLLGLTACSDIKYCAQCVAGHLNVMSLRRPITDVLNDKAVPEAERKQLAKALAIREFAVQKLHLPDNDSYRFYADVARPYVVWNIVATPEFSLSPKQWCYPVVGCLSYRGFYDPEAAKVEAEELADQGYDVDVYGVKAYSTLKWFDDPVLNTFLNGTDSQLAGLIFHELAHQVVYTSDDCSFNEAFAKTVETEGLRRWLQANANDREWQDYLGREQNSKEFLAILSKTREKLSTLYTRPLPAAEMRAHKKEILEGLSDELRLQQKRWVNPAAIDKWLEHGLSNARLVSIATYYDQVPTFRAILNAQEGDLPAFYREVDRLAKLATHERTAQLETYGISEFNVVDCIVEPDNDK